LVEDFLNFWIGKLHGIERLDSNLPFKELAPTVELMHCAANDDTPVEEDAADVA
jgi:hypothetical protein